MPELLLRCGCVVPFREGKEPSCPSHGVQGVARVIGMPAPRFTGAVAGPHARPIAVEPHVGALISGEGHAAWGRKKGRDA